MEGVVETRNDLTKLFQALISVQKQIKPALKDQQNTHLKSKYADLTSVYTACREPLTSNGFCVIQLAEGDNTEVKVTTILAHESGESISSTLTIKPSQPTAQGMGSAITYARRYSLMSMVGIAPEDDDGNDASKGDNGRREKEDVKTQKVDTSKDDFYDGLLKSAKEATDVNALENIWHAFKPKKDEYSETRRLALLAACAERKGVLTKGVPAKEGNAE